MENWVITKANASWTIERAIYINRTNLFLLVEYLTFLNRLIEIIPPSKESAMLSGLRLSVLFNTVEVHSFK